MDAFNSKRSERIAYPLKGGIYKLEEATSNLKEWLAEIERVRVNRVSKGAVHALHSTYKDSHIWLKQTPEYIAELFGYDVAPAITALIHDGVPIAVTRHIKTTHRQKIRSLIQQCDMFYDSTDLNASAKEMHTEMIYQELSHLVSKAVDITEGALTISKVSLINHPLHGYNA